MKFDVKFVESKQTFEPQFGEVHNVSDGGFERGYEAGYQDGFAESESVRAGLLSGSMEHYEDDVTTSVRNYGLAYTELKTLRLGAYKSGGTSAFGFNTLLESVDLPLAQSLPYTAFTGCAALKNVNAPNAKLGYGCFNGCSSLVALYNYKEDYINAMTFSGCAALVTVVLGVNKVATLNNVNAFSNTPIAKGTGYIYVPDNLVESYKTAAKWNTFAAQFKPISELQ